jgi:hypothetical protein
VSNFRADDPLCRDWFHRQKYAKPLITSLSIGGEDGFIFGDFADLFMKTPFSLTEYVDNDHYYSMWSLTYLTFHDFPSLTHVRIWVIVPCWCCREYEELGVSPAEERLSKLNTLDKVFRRLKANAEKLNPGVKVTFSMQFDSDHGRRVYVYTI